ncbi:hypothetical protein PATA110615_23275 [Paenibacillus taichungensis]
MVTGSGVGQNFTEAALAKGERVIANSPRKNSSRYA